MADQFLTGDEALNGFETTWPHSPYSAPPHRCSGSLGGYGCGWRHRPIRAWDHAGASARSIAKAKAEGKYKGRAPTAMAKSDEVLTLPRK